MSPWISGRTFIFVTAVKIMNKYIKLSTPFIFLLSLILIFAFKTVPSGKLWKNYSVVCVPVETPDSKVMTLIEQAGIKNAVSLSGQYLPISLSENSIEVSMLRLNYSSSEYTYLNKRNAMFYDKSKSYRLYYIPGIYASETSVLMKLLDNEGINCIKDSSASYPWILPLIGILLALMLMLFVKNKFPFIAGSIIPLVFLYCNPFYPVATSTCLTLLCLFFSANVWRRRDAVSTLLSKHSIPAMLGIAFLCAFSSSLASGFLFLAACAGTASALFMYWIAEEFLRTRKPFVPVYIRSAKRVSLFAGKAFTSMSIVTGAALLFVILIFITSSSSIRNTGSKLLFPGNSTFSDSSLPQFEDYYKWIWNVKTAPYTSLNDQEREEDTVSFSTFQEKPETGIIEEKKTTMKFDDSFKKTIYGEIDNLQFDSVEKIMKSEGEDFSGGYTAASSYHINIFGIIMCFICLFILLFINFSIIIRKGIHK